MSTSSHADNIRLLSEYSSTRDPKIRDRIVIQNQELIWFIVQRYTSGAATKEDMFQAGVIGLINAINRYNPAYGTRLSTYAVPYIENEIRELIDNPEYIDDFEGLIPVDEYESNPYQEALEKLYHTIFTDDERTVMDVILRTNDEPAWSVNEIAKELGLTGTQVRELYDSGVHKFNEPWVRWYISNLKQNIQGGKYALSEV